MTSTSRLAAVGVLGLLLGPRGADAQGARFTPDVVRVAAVAVGSIEGIVQDEKGLPVGGAAVSALGTTTAYSFTDRNGRFLLKLSPGPYLVRAHLTGFVASRGEMIEVRANSRSSSSIALHRTVSLSSPPAPAPVLAAGIGVEPIAAPPAQPAAPADAGADATPTTKPAAEGDDHSEFAWRLRHLRRGVLQDAMVPDAIIAEELGPGGSPGSASGAFARAAGSSARLAANLFSSTPFSGQVNILTTSSFDSPQQLFSGDNFAHSVAYLSVGAPAGSNADWAVRGAFTQADISSWLIAGAYSTRAPARHRYDIGLSYATQRYDGGNPAALRGLTDGSRNAGEVYGFDSFTMTPAVILTFGTRYARYDYLDGKSLVSPRVALTLSPGGHFRANVLASRRAIAPGAEEFLPPGDNGVWLPPQRTFSALSSDRLLDSERTTHLDLEVERDLGTSSAISVRAFRQEVEGQMVTAFGLNLPATPSANVGHYYIGNYGDAAATGFGAGFRTAIAGRVRGSVAYTMTQARWNPGDDPGPWLQLPAALRDARIHGVATRVETEVPETSTRILILYRVNTVAARRSVDDDAVLDSRFDVQLRQSLPFMDFSTAKWEMLIGVRNFFREMSVDQSVYDELLVVHPPKRIVGGLTMRF